MRGSTITNRYASTIRQMSAQSYWERLLACEWTAYTSAERSKELRGYIFTLFDGDPVSLFTVLTDLAFDAECIYESGENTTLSYYGRIAGFAQDSGGAFQPTRIIDVFDCQKMDSVAPSRRSRWCS